MRLPSGNPLELLPFRQRMIFMARAAHVPMTEIAGLLSISRETAYVELRAAWAALRPRRLLCRRCESAPPEPGRLVCRACRPGPRAKPRGKG